MFLSVQTGSWTSAPVRCVRLTPNIDKIAAQTSGGIAIDHIATPAVPPAMMIALRLRSEGDCPAGVSSFFVTSYAAKYLRNLCQDIERT